MRSLSLLVGLTAAIAAADPRPIAIVKGRVHTGDGPAIEGGTVLLRGGRVEAVGGRDLALPADAQVLDARGGWVTAGLFDAESRVGLVEVLLEPSTVETSLTGPPVRPAFSVLDGFKPSSIVVPVARVEGITTVALAPEGGIVSGRGAVTDLDGRDAAEMTVRSPSAVYVRYSDDAKQSAEGARGGIAMRLRALFDDVRHYAKHRREYDQNRMRRLSAARLDLEALVPVVEGKLPVVFEVFGASDIQSVLRLAKAEGIRVILSGAAEAWKVAQEIATAGVPVILDPVHNLPTSFQSLGARLDNAALLHRAGVRIAISSRGDPHQSRILRQLAGNAVANGLPWEAALRAVSRGPAEIFGVGEQYGTLAAGKVGNVVVWSGDPFETSTRVRHVLIRGRPVSLRTRQTELRDRYRDLSRMRPRY